MKSTAISNRNTKRRFTIGMRVGRDFLLMERGLIALGDYPQ